MMRIRRFTVLATTAFAIAACGSGAADGDEGNVSETPSAAASTLEVEAGDLYFDPAELSASAGEIAVELDNVGAIEHDFVVEEEGDAVVVQASPGETVTGTIELDDGTYTFYCSVPGHRSAGMEGTLDVG